MSTLLSHSQYISVNITHLIYFEKTKLLVSMGTNIHPPDYKADCEMVNGGSEYQQLTPKECTKQNWMENHIKLALYDSVQINRSSRKAFCRVLWMKNVNVHLLCYSERRLNEWMASSGLTEKHDVTGVTTSDMSWISPAGTFSWNFQRESVHFYRTGHPASIFLSSNMSLLWG